MTRTLAEGTPNSQGLVGLGAPRSHGRARRQVAEDGRELWRFETGDVAAGRLAALGADGIGGFVAAGIDADGPWLVRRPEAPTLRHAWREQPGPWPAARVLELGHAIATILAAAEHKSLRPGAVRPDQIAGVGTDALHLRADELVDGLCGAPRPAGSDGHLRWTPAAQTQGEPWDAAAARYGLGLVLYRSLAGEHPFAGKGLRRGLDDQARGVAPLPDEVASALPPGLQALVLRLLDPDPALRPTGAGQILSRLDACRRTPVAHPAPVAIRRVSVPQTTASSRPASSAPMRPAPKPARGGWLSLATLALAVVAAGVAAYGPAVESPPPPPPGPTPGATSPLTDATTSPDDCLACHPDHTTQWNLSVMAHAADSPLFQGLEILIQEQGGRSFDCPDGAGILRPLDERTACRDPDTGLPITGSGGELWCVNCHAAADNLGRTVPAWDARRRRSDSRRPLRDILPARSMEGIGCAMCHQTHGPVRPGAQRRGGYEGNPTWRSTQTGQVFSSRPEDRAGLPGIANSGYQLDPGELIAASTDPPERLVPSGVHRRPSDDAKAYLRSSEFCGACHDVRLFGTDVVGVAERGEHFKRLRNAYSEWAQWADDEVRAGRTASSCQDCHMSEYPAVCDAAAGAPDPSNIAWARACPPGTNARRVAPGSYPQGAASIGSGVRRVTPHYFSGVDVPLSVDPSDPMVDDGALDEFGLPRGAKQRRDLLLGGTFRFELDDVVRSGRRVQIPVEIENEGAGHRVPAGFSQEREIWVHLRVTDASGQLVYEVGRVDAASEDLHDKVMVRVNTRDDILDEKGRPLGMFGADVADGPDVPQWDPPPELGGTRFRGRGLINFQNGFLRCVQCIGRMVGGECEPLPGQERFRADRFEDGIYDPDTGECTGRVPGTASLLETYFPVGSLDATRGVLKAPDAIIDTRSMPPSTPLRYTYDLPVSGASGPLRVTARLLFRAFPPFLVRAFADYEAGQAARGLRPSGPLVTADMLDRLEVVEIARVEREVP